MKYAAYRAPTDRGPRQGLGRGTRPGTSCGDRHMASYWRSKGSVTSARAVSMAKAADKADNSKLFSGPEPRWSASMNYRTEPVHAAAVPPNCSDQSHCVRHFGRHFEPGRMWTKATRRWRLQEAISRRCWRYKGTFEPPQRRVLPLFLYRPTSKKGKGCRAGSSGPLGFFRRTAGSGSLA